MDHNWETTRHLAGRKVKQPTLMIVANNDPILRPEMAEGMQEHVPDLRMVRIDDCGHWTQQEKPEQVNDAMIAFLKETGR